MSREFNEAMGLPVGSAVKCLPDSRGRAYGLMLREEVSELEEAMAAGTLPDVLAESVDVLYLTFNMRACALFYDPSLN